MHLGVEVAGHGAAVFLIATFENGHGPFVPFVRPCLLVRSLAAQGVVLVADVDDSRRIWNILTLEAVWIATAVPALMMGKGDSPCPSPYRGLAIGQDLAAQGRMGLHDDDLFWCQRTRLEQDAIWYAKLADVVQGACKKSDLNIRYPCQGARLDASHNADALHMSSDMTVLALGGAAQGPARLPIGIVQPLILVLDHIMVFPELEMIAHRSNPGHHFLGTDILLQVVLGARRQPPHWVLAISQGCQRHDGDMVGLR